MSTVLAKTKKLVFNLTNMYMHVGRFYKKGKLVVNLDYFWLRREDLVVIRRNTVTFCFQRTFKKY